MIVSNERERALRTKKVLRHIAEGDVIVEEQVMRRGEIYHADLNPVFGSEQGGYRPVLIIQNNRCCWSRSGQWIKGAWMIMLED